MIKTFLSFVCHPLTLLVSTVIGNACISYFEESAIMAIGWCVPIFFAVFCNLVAEIRATMWRGEELEFGNDVRKLITKLIVYFLWVVTSVTIAHQYENNTICKWLMGIVLVIELISCIGNILEPHGMKLNMNAILEWLGEKLHVGNLSNMITKNK